MRILIQRVTNASVTTPEGHNESITSGLLIFVGIEHTDATDDADYLAAKVVALRIFGDDQGVMNRSVIDIKGNILVVSQFTLHARTKKGNRPSYMDAAPPEVAIPLYEYFMAQLESLTGNRVARGVFGANMQVALVNDGPVTIWMDSKLKN
jgi:D-tyrosyl-tRNA(Tyr) deacylase